LDYIEVMEQIKEGYEADVVESDDEDEDPKQDRRAKGKSILKMSICINACV